MSSDLPLDGIRVIETAGVLAGPSVAMFLAELGADVIKLENPRSGDVTRGWLASGEEPSGGVSAYFSSVNWGKRSAAVDLSTIEGKEILHTLVRRSDILVASHRPHDAAKLGLDYSQLAPLNPRLIYARIAAYAENDDRPGYDAVIQAEGGFMAMNGEAAGPPIKMPVALIDVLAAHQLKEAILIALYRRERTGVGAELSSSLFRTAVASLVNQATNWLQAGYLPRRRGSEHPNISPYGSVYRCRDGGDIVLAVGNDSHFERLCAAIGQPALSGDARFATNRARVSNRKELSELLTAAISGHDRADLLAALEALGVPAGAVNDLEGVFSVPLASEMILRDRGAVGVRSIGFAGVSKPRRLGPPPELGEHTVSVLREIGYSELRIDELRQARAIS